MVDNDVLNWTGEHLSFVCDERVGLRAVIAIHDTTLGAGLGGVRLGSYRSLEAAAREAQRLAAAMTVKNALAGIPYGGAKSVIRSSGPINDRSALMRRFGEFVARLAGTYLPGVDMGTSNVDLAEMSRGGAVVSCATTDPSPWTAAGVFAAMRAARQHVAGSADLGGTRVLIQGVGHVGGQLARLCAAAGAEVLVSDVDPDRANSVARETGAVVVDPPKLFDTEADIFSPCAAARVLTAEAAEQLAVPLVVGAANDTLAEDSVAETLRARDICYVPDFVANAGGVLQIHAERAGWDDATLDRAIEAIGERTAGILAATDAGTTPLQTARSWAQRTLDRGRDAGAAARAPVA